MTRRLLPLAGAVLAALLAACGGGGEGAPTPSGVSTAIPDRSAATAPAPRTTPTVGAVARDWASAVCDATADFDEAVLAVQDAVDPTTLSVEERRARGVTRYEAYLEALTASAATLDGVTPPQGASSYHAAVVAQFSELHRIVGEQLERIRAAETHDEIEAANALLRLEVERLNNSVRLAASVLSADAIAALQAVPRCGQIIG